MRELLGNFRYDNDGYRVLTSMKLSTKLTAWFCLQQQENLMLFTCIIQ